MSVYKFFMNALRPAKGPLATMVGAPALQRDSRFGAGTEAIEALQDQLNAINTILRMKGVIEVDGSALPFTPPGGMNGQIQTNNGAGGLGALAVPLPLASGGTNSTDGTIAQPSWTAVSYQNSWVNFGGSTQVGQYAKDTLGWVHVRGLAKDGTTTDATVILTLPAGYRPASVEQFVSDNNGNHCRLSVATNGEVSMLGVTSATSLILNLAFRP